MSRKKSDSVPVFVLGLIYLLSVSFLFFNKNNYDSNTYESMSLFFFANSHFAIAFNVSFLLLNTMLIHRLFIKRDRLTSERIMVFIYFLFHTQIWFNSYVDSYLINDFFILISLFLINPHEEKRRTDLLIFYLFVFFSIGFLLGINLFYAFIIPGLLFNLLLLFGWRSWVISIFGFLFPVYLFITISWLLDYDPFLYLQINISHSLYQFSKIQWADIFSKQSVQGYFQWKSLNIILVFILLIISSMKQASSMYYYSSVERRINLFFFFLMFFSLINYLLVYSFYQKYNFSLISLSFAYYIGSFLNKSSTVVKYFILFLVFVLSNLL